MDNNHLNHEGRQLTLKIPSKILSDKNLSFNQKLILGLDYTLSKKKGYNKMSNKNIAAMFNLHVNIVSYCHKQLLYHQYILKQHGKFVLTDLYKQTEVEDFREIFLPYQIYNHKTLSAGAKLLWGEYNSISKGVKQYFASRAYSANRLNASVESITNWTKQLNDNNLLKSYHHNTGFCKSQRVVVTIEFNEGEIGTEIKPSFNIIGAI